MATTSLLGFATQACGESGAATELPSAPPGHRLPPLLLEDGDRISDQISASQSLISDGRREATTGWETNADEASCGSPENSARKESICGLFAADSSQENATTGTVVALGVGPQNVGRVVIGLTESRDEAPSAIAYGRYIPAGQTRIEFGVLNGANDFKHYMHCAERAQPNEPTPASLDHERVYSGEFLPIQGSYLVVVDPNNDGEFTVEEWNSLSPTDKEVLPFVFAHDVLDGDCDETGFLDGWPYLTFLSSLAQNM